MKRSKRLFILLGILIVICAATFGVMHMEEEKEQIKASGEIILELPAASIQSLSWEYEDTALSFHREERWTYDGDAAFPVDGDKINALLEPFASFGVSFIIESVTDYSMYGLDDPLCTIRLETEDQSYEIQLGSFSSMDQERYISIGDGNVYLAKNDPLDQFDAVLRDLIDQDESLSYDQVSQLAFSGAETYSIYYEADSALSYCAEDVYFTDQDGRTLPLDTGRVDDYLEGLVQLELTDYVTYNAADEDLTAYGLDNPELTITVDYSDGDASGTFVLAVSRDPDELAAASEDGETSEDDGEETITAYARVGESPIIYQISSSDYQTLMAASYNSLRHREIWTAAFADVYQADISLEDSEYTFALADGEEEDQVWSYEEREIEIGDFQDALEALRASGDGSFTSEQPDGQKEIGLTLYLHGENDFQIEIALYRWDGSNCLAVVDGESVALIPRAGVVELIEAVHSIVLN